MYTALLLSRVVDEYEFLQRPYSEGLVQVYFTLVRTTRLSRSAPFSLLSLEWLTTLADSQS